MKKAKNEHFCHTIDAGITRDNKCVKESVLFGTLFLVKPRMQVCCNTHSKNCMKNQKQVSNSRVAVLNKLSLVHLSNVASMVSVCHSCCNTALMSPMAPNFLCQLRSYCWYREIYSRTSNNGHYRGIQILSVIGGVR